MGLLTGLNEVERELTRERTRESIDYRKKIGGNLGGRPTLPKIKRELIIRFRREGNSIRRIAEQTGVSTTAVHKTCKAGGI